MAPEVQQCVCFFKCITQIDKPLRNIARKAEEPVFICCIHRTIRAPFPGTTGDPITDLVIQLLGFRMDAVLYVAEFLESIHDLKCLGAAAYPEDAFQSDDSTGPHSGDNFVAVAAVADHALPESHPGCQLRPVSQYPLALGQLRSGQLDPTVVEQALHIVVPPNFRIRRGLLLAAYSDADS